MRIRFILTLALLLAVGTVQGQDTNPNYRAAADYSLKHKGDAILIYVGGQQVFEEYQNGYDGNTPHQLASGSKSFTCALAAAAVQDGLFTLDEPVSQSITEWAEDAKKPSITIRQLLNQTGGLPGAQAELQGPRAFNKAEAAIKLKPIFKPGERFDYGPSNFYIFGELIKRKLNNGEDALAYLVRRVLNPIGLQVADWQRDRSGNPNLANGAFMTAWEWAKYGQLVLQNGNWNGQQLLDAGTLSQCFVGTNANPYYGLSFWLLYDFKSLVNAERLATISPQPGLIPAGVTLGQTPPVVMFAAGTAQQRLYIIPSLNMAVVRLGRLDRRWRDGEFLGLLTGG
jgi:CubicO group peptidase (beta-lactamase class C family)